jgi:hypothetical protein
VPIGTGDAAVAALVPGPSATADALRAAFVVPTQAAGIAAGMALVFGG